MRQRIPHNSGNQQSSKKVLSPTVLLAILAFLLGCVISGSLVLNLSVLQQPHSSLSFPSTTTTSALQQEAAVLPNTAPIRVPGRPVSKTSAPPSTAVLDNVKILVVLVAFDFSQIPHLEEVLDSYHDCAVAGAHVNVTIHATVAYPVAWIDMWNDRFTHPHFALTIALKPKSLRLHLVDCHRQDFYQHIDDFDLFIYSEDDIRVTPTTVASYWMETQRIETLLQHQTQYKPSDFNVGIVRYEYNYPSNVVMDDKTRHATQNVTRVYWEHSSFTGSIVPNTITSISQAPLAQDYVTMKNHHQGMYLATSSLLKAWKERCKFDVATNRPGRGSQPTEGTQRVWMSSQMLYGGRRCGVQQVLPLHRFGTLTVWHLPNKNYRRVGKYRKRIFSDGTEVFDQPQASLLKALDLHVALKKEFLTKQPSSSRHDASASYTGIRMVDQVDRPRDRTHVLERRMKEYNAYVQRGGVMTEKDMAQTELSEPE